MTNSRNPTFIFHLYEMAFLVLDGQGTISLSPQLISLGKCSKLAYYDVYCIGYCL